MKVEQRMEELGLKPGALVQRTNRVAALQPATLSTCQDALRSTPTAAGSMARWAAT